MKRKFWEGNTSPRLYYILQEYKRNDPQWRNNHRKEIEKKILMFLSRLPKSEDETGGNGRRKMLTPAGMEETQHRFNLTYIDEDGNEEPVPGYMHGDSLPIENHRADSSDEGSIEEERLECLTEKQREAWKLKQQGLTYNEIAAELNISYVGARNHVIHAEQKLQKYDSQAEMEKGRGESAGVLWTAKPPEQEIGVTGNTNYPVEQPLSRADALLMLKLVGDYIKTCEYVTPHNAKKEWVSRMPYMYGYAMNLEKKLQLAVYGEIQYPPNRDYEKQIKECEPAETVDDEGELDGMKEAE